MGYVLLKNKDILRVLKKEPRLTSNGLEFKNKDLLRKSRKELLSPIDVERFYKCCEWLSQISMTKRLNRQHSSYYLKHVAENDIGYIGNGTFIASAIHCGFKYSSDDLSPYFNMSYKSIEDLVKNK